MEGLGLLMGAAVAALAGVAIGTLTGLTPGLHVNLVAQLLLLASGPLVALVAPLTGDPQAALLLACLVCACAVAHSFLDVLPSVFLGAPDPDEVMSVLPGHRMMLRGRGAEAVRISLLASLGAVVLAVALFLPFKLLLGPPVGLYAALQPAIPWLLVLAMAALVLAERPREGMPLWDALSAESLEAHPRMNGLAVPASYPLAGVEGARLLQGRIVREKGGRLLLETADGQAWVAARRLDGLEVGDEAKLHCVAVRRPGVLAHAFSRLLALSVLLASGLIGLIVLGTPGLAAVVSSPVPALAGSNLLMPLLTGLFGLSGILLSVGSSSGVPAQEGSSLGLPARTMAKAVAAGTLAGSLVGWLPGITSSQASVVSRFVRPGPGASELDRDRTFLAVVAAVGTANAMFVLLALFAIGRARSGAMGAVLEMLGGTAPAWDGVAPPQAFLLLLLATVVAAAAGYLLGHALAGPAGALMARVPQGAVACAVGAFLVAVCILLTGPFGLLILIPATTLGMLPPLVGVRRVHLMGCILVPTALFLLGVEGEVLGWMGLL